MVRKPVTDAEGNEYPSLLTIEEGLKLDTLVYNKNQIVKFNKFVKERIKCTACYIEFKDDRVRIVGVRNASIGVIRSYRIATSEDVVREMTRLRSLYCENFNKELGPQ